ncbi:MAG: hypothetical protein C4530_24150 [Desulfobacteraceae bacterium]|nr:MAG: hypothetical protein C4530_24150 [Desulfobacteraceae bacterium]
MKRINTAIVLGMLVILLSPVSRAVAQDSLFERYTQTAKDTLSGETVEMGQELRAAFSQGSVKDRQQQIDFAEYFSHLRKAVLYASRLSVYGTYSKDLKFARDNEIFKGLPEDRENANGGPQLDRKGFVQSKYDRMKKNVEEEIETYKDLILMSLDSCEALTGSDLSGILIHPKHSDRIRSYVNGDEYREYKVKADDLKKGWPELEARIAAQIALWQPRPASPDTPILDTQIVGAL